MKVILEIDDLYSGVLSVTAVGKSAFETRVTTTVVDLSKFNCLKIDTNGKWTHERRAEDGAENR